MKNIDIKRNKGLHLIVAPKAQAEIDWLTNRMASQKGGTKEVGWMFEVQAEENDTDIFVCVEPGIIIFEQEVASATTDQFDDGMTALIFEYLEAEKDPSKLRCWGHLHPGSMGVSPSSTDEDSMRSLCTQNKSGYYVRSIHNNIGDSRWDLYDLNRMVQYDKVTPINPYFLDADYKEALEAVCQEKIKEKKFPTYHNPHQKALALSNNQGYDSAYKGVYNTYSEEEEAWWNNYQTPGSGMDWGLEDLLISYSIDPQKVVVQSVSIVIAEQTNIFVDYLQYGQQHQAEMTLDAQDEADMYEWLDDQCVGLYNFGLATMTQINITCEDAKAPVKAGKQAA